MSCLDYLGRQDGYPNGWIAGFEVYTSTDGTNWSTVAQVRGTTHGTQDMLSFPPVRARYVRIQITAATYGTPPLLEEITVPGTQAQHG